MINKLLFLCLFISIHVAIAIVLAAIFKSPRDHSRHFATAAHLDKTALRVSVDSLEMLRSTFHPEVMRIAQVMRMQPPLLFDPVTVFLYA